MTRTWGGEYPGQHIDTLTVSEVETAIIQTAMRLGHPVVFKHARDREFYVYAARK